MTKHHCLLDETVELRRSISDCYRYLLDFSSAEQWDPGVYRAEKVTPGMPAAGTEFALSLNFMGRRPAMHYRLEKAEENRRLQLSGRGDGFSAEDDIQFEALGSDRTRIRYLARISMDSHPLLPKSLISTILERSGRRAMQGLQRALQPSTYAPEPDLWTRLADRTLLPAMWNFTERGYLKMADKGLTEFMDGRVAAITGPTSGLGLAAAQLMSRLGAQLILIGRDTQRLQAAAESVRSFSGAPAHKVQCVSADLLLPGEIQAAVQAVMKCSGGRLDVLLNNAGALFNERAETAAGIERSLAVNLLAPFQLTEALMPALQRTGATRVINMASGGMYTQALRLDDLNYEQTPYDGPKAYARAKRGLVAVTEYWAEQQPDVDFHAMHPGWAATPGVAEALPAFNQKLAGHLRDARMGADTAVWLASSQAVAGESGGFWLDRQRHPTALLPGTAHSAEQTAALVDWLRAQPIE